MLISKRSIIEWQAPQTIFEEALLLQNPWDLVCGNALAQVCLVLLMGLRYWGTMVLQWDQVVGAVLTIFSPDLLTIHINITTATRVYLPSQ